MAQRRPLLTLTVLPRSRQREHPARFRFVRTVHEVSAAVSGVSQRAVYTGVGGLLAVVEALGVDAEQDFDAVSCSLGDALRRDSGGQPQGHGRVAQVVGASGQG
jgi:hypothetical protein